MHYSQSCDTVIKTDWQVNIRINTSEFSRLTDFWANLYIIFREFDPSSVYRVPAIYVTIVLNSCLGERKYNEINTVPFEHKSIKLTD
jgi:hypothetical protein